MPGLGGAGKTQCGAEIAEKRWDCLPIALRLLAGLSGFAIVRPLGHGSNGAVLGFLALELAIMCVAFAPMGALLPELFPTQLRYGGAAAAYSLRHPRRFACPYAAQRLVTYGSLPWVGYYITAAAAVSFLAIFCLKEHPGAIWQR